ncbi:hypothetical protein ABH900_003005 [Stenotrophomonas sp. AN71]|uniref:hypothetical protein n=1 Tax=Stenotrophomonas sp. AN71 TaxID=3156253 RepID=UPI003D1EE9B6
MSTEIIEAHRSYLQAMDCAPSVPLVTHQKPVARLDPWTRPSRKSLAAMRMTAAKWLQQRSGNLWQF